MLFAMPSLWEETRVLLLLATLVSLMVSLLGCSDSASKACLGGSCNQPSATLGWNGGLLNFTKLLSSGSSSQVVAWDTCPRCPVGQCDSHSWGWTHRPCLIHAHDQSYHCVTDEVSCRLQPKCHAFGDTWYYALNSSAPCVRPALPIGVAGPAECERCPIGKCDRKGGLGSPCTVLQDNMYHCIINSCADVPYGYKCWDYGVKFYTLSPTQGCVASLLSTTSTTTTNDVRPSSCERCPVGACEKWGPPSQPCHVHSHDLSYHCLVTSCPTGRQCFTWNNPNTGTTVIYYTLKAPQACIRQVSKGRSRSPGLQYPVGTTTTPAPTIPPGARQDAWCERCPIGTCDKGGDQCQQCKIFGDNAIHCLVNTCPSGKYCHTWTSDTGVTIIYYLIRRDAPCLTYTMPFTPIPGRTLKWHDEFNTPGKTAPNSSIWTHEIGIGPNNNGWDHDELQYYTDNLTNAYVSNGTLKIVALRENFQGSRFTSARLITRNKQDWTYGCTEVRAKLPIGSGTWSAMWMLATDNKYGAWPQSGEIDIVEHVGNFPSTVQTSVHTLRDNHRTSLSIFNKTCAPVEDWRVYSICWTSRCLHGYVDSDQFFEYCKEANATWDTWPFDQPFFGILNLAVGGKWGKAIHGMRDQDFDSPGQVLEIDYVRVYDN